MHSRLSFTEDRAQKAFRLFKQRIYEEIQNRRESRFACPILWLKGFVLLTLSIGSYLSLLLFTSSGTLALFYGAVFGLSILIFALNVSHDAAHGSFSKNQRINDVLLFIPFSILGVDPKMWRARHLVSHHRFPNVDSCDADIDKNPFIRLSPHQQKRTWHHFQHVYAWILYFIVALHAAWIQDFQYMRREELANMRDWRTRISTWPHFS